MFFFHFLKEKIKLFSKILVGWNFGNGEVKRRPVS
jgi:hypothetical protein